MSDYLQNVKLLFFTNALIIANDELIERETNRTEISSLSSNGNSRNKFYKRHKLSE